MIMNERLEKLKNSRLQLEEYNRQIDEANSRRDKRKLDELKSSRKVFVQKVLRENWGNKGEEVYRWVATGLEPEMIFYTEFFGCQVADEGLTTSQIRNLYHEAKKIQMAGASDLARLELARGAKSSDNINFSAQNALLMMGPRLSYAAARSGKTGGKLLKQALTAGLNAVMETDDVEQKIERFNNFSDFFEAVLCYHKTAGGKDSDKN